MLAMASSTTTSSSFSSSLSNPLKVQHQSHGAARRIGRGRREGGGKARGLVLFRRVAVRSHRVELNVKGETHVLEVDDDTSILDAGLDAGLELPHDCKMGVCMTCPARVVSGEVDQTQGMLDEDAQEKGFALMCVAYARGDVKIDLIDEDSLVDEMMVGHQ